MRFNHPSCPTRQQQAHMCTCQRSASIRVLNATIHSVCTHFLQRSPTATSCVAVAQHNVLLSVSVSSRQAGTHARVNANASFPPCSHRTFRGACVWLMASDGLCVFSVCVCPLLPCMCVAVAQYDACPAQAGPGCSGLLHLCHHLPHVPAHQPDATDTQQVRRQSILSETSTAAGVCSNSTNVDTNTGGEVCCISTTAKTAAEKVCHMSRMVPLPRCCKNAACLIGDQLC